MPKLRGIGNLAQMLLKQHLAKREAELQNEMITERQRGLADYEHDLALDKEDVEYKNQVRLRDIDADNKMSDRFAADPDLASRSAQSGNAAAAPFIRRDDELFADVDKQIRDAKTPFDMPDPTAALTGRKNGIMFDLSSFNKRFAIPDPQGRPGYGAEGSLYRQSQAIGEKQAFEDDRQAANKFSETYNQGMAEEDVAAQTHGAVLGRQGKELGQQNAYRVSLERGLTPIMVDRAGQSSGASARAQQAVENSNPIVASVAQEVIANPARLESLTPTMRAQVIAHVRNAGGELGTARDKSVGQTLLDAKAALNNLKTGDGMSGAVGAKGMSSLFGARENPLGGTAAASYVTYIDQLKSALTLPRLEFLRGLGHMSDREFGAVSSSVTSLNRQMREEDFMNELGVIEKNINEALVRAGLAEPEETEQNVVLETGRSKLQNRRGGAR
jgi:hypothetical protein